jgi:trans-2-enoyl-CoA reductase
LIPKIDEEDVQAGLQRLEGWVASFDESLRERLTALAPTKTAPKQPWLIAGVSDGMGLLTTLAAIDSGLMRHGVGLYWEPPHLLERSEDGTPVSPIHIARVQNAIALQRFAAARGVDFRVHSINVILAPQRDLKGRAKSDPKPLPAALEAAWAGVMANAEIPDAIFVDSVAFGKWISPREGIEAIATPSVDFEGRVVETSTKKYHARGYQETMDTMGRNHRLLLDGLRSRGWLGPDSVTVFLTWAGGSQNVDVLDGIYGRGSLGDAKIIAESDITRFRLDHPTAYGSHAIVRLPAFLSAALMGIPGGGLFGLISRRVLENHRCFEDMPRLALRMLEKLFGPAWVRENPIAQIELDTAEILHVEEIKRALHESHERIEKVWASQNKREPIPADVASTLLEDLLPANHLSILARFRPSLSVVKPVRDPLETAETDDGYSYTLLPTEIAGKQGDLKPDALLFSSLARLSKIINGATSRFHVSAHELRLTRENVIGNDRVRAEIKVEQDQENLILYQRFVSGDGRTLATGRVELTGINADRSLECSAEELGEPMGFSMPIRSPLASVYGDGGNADRPLLDAPAMVAFAHDQLDGPNYIDHSPTTWTVHFGPRPGQGDRLQAYANIAKNRTLVTVVDQDRKPLLRIQIDPTDGNGVNGKDENQIDSLTESS